LLNILSTDAAYRQCRAGLGRLLSLGHGYCPAQCAWRGWLL